jgi:hypothetical protein
MPFYRVRVHGQGIRLPQEGGSSDIVGFYRVQSVRATTPDQAGTLAIASIASAWEHPRYAATNLGSRPRLEVEAVVKSSWLEHLKFKNGGHVFYPQETDA